MVKAFKGALIQCDDAILEIIISLNTTKNFIVQVLDRGYLIIQSDRLKEVNKLVSDVLQENIYRAPQ